MTRLFAFPLRLKAPNGYWDQLYKAIAADVPSLRMYHADWTRLARSFGERNIIHIHWPLQLYGSAFSGVAWLRFFIRMSILLLAQARGDRIVWTLHNFSDHERRFPFLDSLAHAVLARFSHAVIVHSPAGRAYLETRWGRRDNVYIIPHGHYIGFHGPRRESRDTDLMRELGLRDEDIVFLAIGTLRPYKGLEALMDIFRALPKNAKLFIGGSGREDDSYVRQLRGIAPTNTLIRPGLIADKDIPRFFSLGIFSLYAFTEILTSGSLILSLSYGVPVVAPARGDIPYIVKDDVNGYLYTSAAQLKEAIERILHLPSQRLAAFHRAAMESVSNPSYQDIARMTRVAYGIS